MTARPDSRVGTDLGPYRIERVIGRGGMGVVYLATHAGLDRKVALKLLAPDYAGDEAFRARFLRESRMAAAIDHPNIIPIYRPAKSTAPTSSRCATWPAPTSRPACAGGRSSRATRCTS
jgi:serine/threonine-protein kinase